EEVCECLQETGSEMLISPNGSPFDWPKPDQRMNVAVARVKETSLPLLYVNQVGGQDELVFGGASFVLNADAGLAAQLPAWVDALGPERVHCVMLPYRYTSNESLSDAADCAKALGVRYDIVPIAPAVEGFLAMLGTMFAGRSPDVTEENVQSRVRGTALMAVS